MMRSRSEPLPKRSSITRWSRRISRVEIAVAKARKVDGGSVKRVASALMVSTTEIMAILS